MRETSVTGRRLLVLASLIACFTALFGVVAWVFARMVLDLHGDELTLAVSVASGAGAIFGSTFAQPLFGAWLTRVLEPPLPAAPSPEQLDRWSGWLRTAVLDRRVRGARSQREQMLRGGVLIDLVASPGLTLRPGPAGRPHVRPSGAPASWSKLVDDWDAAEGRMVIIGDPGYGKTFAALSLISHIDQQDDGVAELFPLADWHAWSAGRPDASIDEWLPAQLVQTYPELPPGVARALVTEAKLIPVFDGLDEVPDQARPDCRDALEAYAGREEPFRPFVVTCRQREYFALSPKWVGADRHVALVGLDPERIAAVLRDTAPPSEGWTAVIEAVERGDEAVVALLRSPLRLVASLEAYRRRDPRELLDLASQEDAREQLWNLLLAADRRAFGDASPEQIRRWLAFLAASLKSHSRTRFWLHELYLYAAPKDRRRFQAVTFGLAGALLLCVTALGDISVVTAIFAPLIAVFVVVMYRRTRDAPMEYSVRGRVSARQYASALPPAVLTAAVAWIPYTVVFTAALLAVLGLALGLRGELDRFGDVVMPAAEFVALSGLLMAIWVVVDDVLEQGTSSVANEPPAHLAGRGPEVVLAGTRNQGLAAAVLTLLPVAVVSTQLWDEAGIYGPLTVAITTVSGWTSGLGAWAYFHWARWRLARAGLLPFDLRAFLDWASGEPGWLRSSDAYEFRHKELLDHLAEEGEPVGAGNLSWAESEATRGVTRGVAAAEERRGDRLLEAKDYGGALTAYTLAIEAAPHSAQLHRMRAQALEKLGRHEEQLEAARAALALDPNDSHSLTSMCVAHDRLGDLDTALEYALRALELGPDTAVHHTNLVGILQRLGREDEAVQALTEAARRLPREARIRTRRFETIRALRDPEAARGAAEQLVRDEPDRLDAHWQLAVMRRRVGDAAGSAAARREAVRLASRAKRRGSAAVATRLYFSWELNERGFNEDALRLVSPLSNEKDRRVGVLTELAIAHADLGRLDEAEHEVAEAERLAESASEHNSLANALIAVGRFEAAEDRVSRALRDAPVDVTYLFTRAEAALAGADADAAERTLAEALDTRAREKGQTDLIWLCRVLWRHVPEPQQDQLIDMLVAQLASYDMLHVLGKALVDATPATPDQTGRGDRDLTEWCTAWGRHEPLRGAVDTVMALAGAREALR